MMALVSALVAILLLGLAVWWLLRRGGDYRRARRDPFWGDRPPDGMSR